MTSGARGPSMTERLKSSPRWIIAAVLMSLAAATIYPLLFAINVSLKTKRNYVLDRFGVTDSFTAGNYGNAWENSDLGRYMINSLTVTLGSVFLLLILGSMAGYAFAQLNFGMNKIGYFLTLGALMVPFQVIMVPFLRLMVDTSLLNTYWGLCLAYVSVFLPFTVYLMASFYRRLPRSLFEAALIDGATIWGVFRHIALPISRPALLSVGILNALFVWNDVLISLLVMQDSNKRTLMIGVTSLRGQYSSNIPVFAAGVMIAAFPVILIYIFFQRQISDGVTAGATKG